MLRENGEKWEPIIGLEIHLELDTKSKFFCSCPNKESSEPNSNVCPICMGHPGVLPVLNKEAIKRAIILGLALKGEINEKCWFDRKNYFYPDLPKGYQISQYGLPLIKGGCFEIEIGQGVNPIRKDKNLNINPLKSSKDKELGLSNGVKNILLERIHLEEDTAKLFHAPEGQGNCSLVDFNRAGIPLLEIVTKPIISSPEEAKIFLEELQRVARYLEISNADMEKGQMRCDANVSLRPSGDKKLYPKTEIKNLNSFKAVEHSLHYELARQLLLWEKGAPPQTQTTRGWDDKKGITVEQRSKEEVEDYRYFPEPDLPPLNFKNIQKLGINLIHLKKDLPELPRPRKLRFMKMYGFDAAEAKILTSSKNLAHFTEKVISELRAWLVSLETVEGSEKNIWQKNKKTLVKLVANWLINRILALLKAQETEVIPITPENFSEFIIYVYEKKVSSTIAQKILEKMFYEKKDLDRVVAESKLEQVDDENKLEEVITQVIAENPEIVKSFQSGKYNVIQYLIGQAMKKTKGQAKPELLKKIFEKRLKK